MGWQGRLQLNYRVEDGRTLAHDRHHGPLRVLQRLYPEGDAVCHHVLVHPPGGLVGGDELDIDVHLAAQAHAVVTTPGATRFYRSEQGPAIQRTRLRLAPKARLEWLPLETIAYDGCLGENHIELDLAPEAQAMGWDFLALGLPAAGLPFQRGSFLQHLHWPGHWLERGRIDASDTPLLKSPLGWAGHSVLGMLWFAAAGPPAAPKAMAGENAALVAHLAATAQGLVESETLAGVTCPHPHVVVLRVLAPRVEPVFSLLRRVRAAWRQQAWKLNDHPPRIWST
jgi:urease accessory protein